MEREPATSARLARLARRALVPLPFIAWCGFCVAQGERRWELPLVALLVTVLAWGGARSTRLLRGLYPIGLLGLLYDSMRFVEHLGITPERVHVCDLRALELRFFGVGAAGSQLTLQDWFALHPSTWLDLLCAVPYGTFVFATLACALLLYRRDPAAMQRFGWTFLCVNVIGFATYHLYPAAPPWYFHAHGCVVDLNASASEGPRLSHVDALLGVGYFHGFYGRSHDVFGAVPSLHVAYPLLILLYGQRHFGPLLRVLASAFFVAMCFAAVYLDHHWVIDLLVGIAYTLTVHLLVTWVWVARRRGEQRASVAALARVEGEHVA